MKIKLLVLFVSLVFPVLIQAQKTQRFIAVTIDDLPVVSTRKDLKTRREITTKLLNHITKARVPAIGFVNEGKLYANDVRDEAQIDLLRQWLDAGLELGNHTFSHMSLHDNSLEKYKADILKGEIVTREISKAKRKPLRFFRHPYLWTGLSLEIKNDLNAFCPHTITRLRP
jgi:peptidoglycan/xylan/chitin deacetylase (PgdA/CDA1 family)